MCKAEPLLVVHHLLVDVGNAIERAGLLVLDIARYNPLRKNIRIVSKPRTFLQHRAAASVSRAGTGCQLKASAGMRGHQGRHTGCIKSPIRPTTIWTDESF